MRSSNAPASHDSNSAAHSYLANLRNIAINERSLSSTTLARLKEAGTLVGSRRVRSQKSDKATDHIEDEEGGNVLELDLLTPDRIVIADDTIALQQFGMDVFCAPQEEILEGEYDSTSP